MRAPPDRRLRTWTAALALLGAPLGGGCSAPEAPAVATQQAPRRPLWIGPEDTFDDGNDNFRPAIAGDGRGGYLVAYGADTCGDGCDDMLAYFVDTNPADGSYVLRAVGPLEVAGISRQPLNVAVAYSDGVYLVVWEEEQFINGGRRGRIAAATVTATVGEEASSGRFYISDDLGSARNPVVAGMPGGRWLVAWEDDQDVAEGLSIRGRLVTTEQQLIPALADANFTSDGGAARNERSPALAWDGARFLLGFTDSRGGGDIYGAMIDATTTATPTATAAFPISRDASDGDQRRSTVACNAATCLVAWVDARNGGDADVYGNRVVAGAADAVDVALAAGSAVQDSAIAVASVGPTAARSYFMLSYSDENSGPSAAWLDGATLRPLAPPDLLARDVGSVASAGPGQFLTGTEVEGATTFADIALSFVLALPDGAACPTALPQGGSPDPATPADGCLSGVCVGGLCCSSACDGVCATCDGVGTAAPAGTCGPRSAGSAVCRAGSPDGVCDPAEACDGVALDCPADVVRTSTFTCRPAAAAPTCDVSETCPGTPLADCPADAFQRAGEVCRAGSGDACNPTEMCSGTSAACPADQALADGVSCDDDTLVCNGGAMCAAGMCMAVAAPSCDDGDPCTQDSCAEPSGCAHTEIAGCRDTDAGVRDGGVRADAGGRADAGQEDPEVEGCDCGVNGSPASGAPFVLFAIGYVLARRRVRVGP